MIPRPENPLVVALDVSDLDAAEALARTLEGHVGMVKVGLELFSAHGPASVSRLRAYAPVFLDLKLHDIPTTVERAAGNVARSGASMLTVHALGGEAMVAAAVRGAERGAGEAGHPVPVVLAVTVLSSLAGEGLASPGVPRLRGAGRGGDRGRRLGRGRHRRSRGRRRGVCLVVPGIRPAGSNGHDQVRVLTPEEAMERGADFLVVGRPITASPDPAGVARSILASVR